MAEVTDESPDMSDSQKREKTPLEELPKEELVKQCQKYLTFLQRAKKKCDELNNKCATLEEDRDLTNKVISELKNKLRSRDNEHLQREIKELQKKVAELTEEKKQNVDVQELRTDLENTRKEKERFSRSCRELDEQVQCLKLKVDTLTATCQCLQEEVSKCNENNKEMKNEVNVLLQARDTALEALKKVKDQLKASESERQSNLLEIENFKKTEIQLREKLQSMSEKIIQNESKTNEDDNKNLVEENSVLVEKHKEIQNAYDSLKHELESIAKEKDNLFEENKELLELKSKIIVLEQSESISKKENSDLQQICQELQNARSSLMQDNHNIQEENVALKSKITELENCKIELLNSSKILQTQLEETKSEIEKLDSMNKSLSDNVSAFTVKYDKVVKNLGDQSDLLNNAKQILLSISCFQNKANFESLDFPAISEYIRDEYENLEYRIKELANSHDEAIEALVKLKYEHQILKQEKQNNLLETENLKNTEAKLRDELLSLTEKVSQNSDVMSGFEDRNRVLTEENSVLIEKHKEIQNDHESLKSQIKNMLTEKEDLCKELSQVKLLHADLQKTESICKEENSNLKQQCKESESKQATIMQDNDEIKKKNSVLASEITELETNNLELSNSVKMLQDQLNEAKLEVEKTNEISRNQDLLTLMSKHDEITKELEQKNDTLHNMQKLLLSLTCFQDEAGTEVSDLSGLCAIVCSEYQQLKTKVNALNEKIQDYEKKETDSSSLSTKIQELENEKADAVLQLEHVNEEFNSLKAKLEMYSSIEKEKSELLVENSVLAKKSDELLSEIETLKQQLDEYENDIQKHQNLENENDNLQACLKELEKENDELSEGFGNKCVELMKLNEHLESIIMSIEQALKLENVLQPEETENEPLQNMHVLKDLCDEMFFVLNRSEVKINSLETDLADIKRQKHSIENELTQIKDLQQFLEDEVKALRDENEQMKSASNSRDQTQLINIQSQTSVFSNDVSTSMERHIICDIAIQTEVIENSSKDVPERKISDSRENFYGISEWGCADEDNEVVSHSIIVDQSQVNDAFEKSGTFTSHSESLNATNACVQTSVTMTSISTDVSDLISNSSQTLLNERNTSTVSETEFFPHLNGVNENVSKINEDARAEVFSEEIENLKSQLETKSKLVEQIHCQMDSLLTKVEDLNAEIHDKNLDMEALQKVNNKLQMELSDLKSFKTSQGSMLLEAKSFVNNIREMESSIKVDVNTFNSYFISALSNTSNVLHSMQSEYNNCKEHLRLDYEQKISIIENEISRYKECLQCVMSEINDMFDIVMKLSHKNDLNEKKITGDTDSNHYNSEASDNFIKKILLRCTELKSEIHSHSTTVSQLEESKIKQCEEIQNFEKVLVPSLEKKIQDLESSLNSSQTGDESAATVNDETEILHRRLSETEIKMNKFKAVAIKLKRELAEYKQTCENIAFERDQFKLQVTGMATELDSISTTHSQYVLNFQNLQKENDKLQDDCDALKSTIKTLQSDLSTTCSDLCKCQESLAAVELELQHSKDSYLVSEKQKTDMDNKLVTLESQIIVLKSKISDDQSRIESLVAELAESQKQVADVLKEKGQLKQKLNDAVKEEKQQSLLDLEMADYERSIEELTLQLTKKIAENEELMSDISNLKTKVDTLQEEIKFCENHRETEEKRANGFKEALETTKRELMMVREHENELMDSFAQLNLKVETLGQKEEDYKSQLSKQSAEVERLKEMIKTSAESHHRIVKSLESKIASQKQDILIAHKEVESVKQDFENYKIRVHSVLKQQKTVATFAPSEAEEKEQLEAQNEKLKLQIKDLSEKLHALTLESDSLREEHDHLLQRHNKVVEELELKDKNWSNRLEQVNIEKSRVQSLLEDMNSEHAVQSEMLAATYKKQIRIIQEEHKHALNELQKQLESADIEIAHLQREQQKNTSSSNTASVQDEPFVFDIFSQERQEGEGSECTEDGRIPIKHLSLATIPTSGFLPLDKLLQSPAEPETPTSMISNTDSEKLNNELNSSLKKIDHLSELLNESEANNLRLGEQVRVLKEEVRRIERNKQRTEHAENLEYLKNVFVKFATLTPGSEKAMLVPVLTTILRLSPAEQQALKLVAGDDLPISTSAID